MPRSLEREASPILSQYPALASSSPCCPHSPAPRPTPLWVHENWIAPMDGPQRRSDRRQFRCTRTAGAICVRIVRNGPGIGFQGLGADGCGGIGLVIVRGTVRHLSAGKPLDRNDEISGSDNADGADGRAPPSSGALVIRVSADPGLDLKAVIPNPGNATATLGPYRHGLVRWRGCGDQCEGSS